MEDAVIFFFAVCWPEHQFDNNDNGPDRVYARSTRESNDHRPEARDPSTCPGAGGARLGRRSCNETSTMCGNEGTECILCSLEDRVSRHSSGSRAESTYATRVGLDVDTPLCGVEVERLEGTLAAQDLELVDVLVTTIVTSVGETFRVLVGQDGAVGLHGGLTRQVLRRR